MSSEPFTDLIYYRRRFIHYAKDNRGAYRPKVMEMAHNNSSQALGSVSPPKPAKYRRNSFVINDETNQIIDELSP